MGSLLSLLCFNLELFLLYLESSLARFHQCFIITKTYFYLYLWEWYSKRVEKGQIYFVETAETLEASETLENQCLSKLKRFGGISEVFPRQFRGILEVSEEYSKEHNY